MALRRIPRALFKEALRRRDRHPCRARMEVGRSGFRFQKSLIISGKTRLAHLWVTEVVFELTETSQSRDMPSSQRPLCPAQQIQAARIAYTKNKAAVLDAARSRGLSAAGGGPSPLTLRCMVCVLLQYALVAQVFWNSTSQVLYGTADGQRPEVVLSSYQQ